MSREEQPYYTQATPDGRTFSFSLPEGASARETEVVYVDARKFLRLIEEHSPEQFTGPEQLRHVKQSGLMGDWAAHPQRLLKMSCLQVQKRMVFAITSGSADLLAALQDSGAVTFPVAVSTEQAPLLRKLCGAPGTPAATHSGHGPTRPPKP